MEFRLQPNGIKLSNHTLDITMKAQLARMFECGPLEFAACALTLGISLKQMMQFLQHHLRRTARVSQQRHHALDQRDITDRAVDLCSRLRAARLVARREQGLRTFDE